MELDPREPIIIVKVEIFGESESRIMEMALDTGATYTIVPWKVVESLGYDPASSRKRLNLVTASTTEIVPIITVKSMSLYGYRIDNVEIACHDLPPKSRVDGLLGLNLLRNFDLDLHFKQRLLEIRDP